MFKYLFQNTSKQSNNSQEEEQDEDRDGDPMHQYAINTLDARREAEWADIARGAVNGYINAAYRAHVDIEEVTTNTTQVNIDALQDMFFGATYLLSGSLES